TAGLTLTSEQARRCAVFAQVNVSLDAGYRAVRGFDGEERALAALKLLRFVHPRVGLNCVVTRENFSQLADTFALARRLRLNQLQLLRFKPTGRGAAHPQLALTRDQAEVL